MAARYWRTYVSPLRRGSYRPLIRLAARYWLAYGSAFCSMMAFVLPRNRWGDSVCSWSRFIVHHRRFPHTTGGGYADRLYRMKTDGMLYDPLRQLVTDKEYAKYYVAGVVGREHTIETYQVLSTEDEVDGLTLDRLPCVLKPTHASGHVMIQTGPEQPLDRALLKSWLRLDYYGDKREHNGKYLRPKIIVEEYFSDGSGTTPRDYKVFCFHGVPEVIQVDADRYGDHTQNFYDPSWHRLPCVYHVPNRPEGDPRPELLEKMLDVAARLSRSFSFIRVDLYTNKSAVKVGELTNLPNAANASFEPVEFDRMMGRLFERGGMRDAERLRSPPRAPGSGASPARLHGNRLVQVRRHEMM